MERMSERSRLVPQERIDDLRLRYRLSDVARRRTKLVRRGGEWTGLCPFHSEKTASFTVNDVKGFAHCFGCAWHGDIIRFVEDSEHVGFREAIDMIDGGALPAVDPADTVRARDEDDRDKETAVADARLFWENARAIGETPADRYLSWRKIFVRPPVLRFDRIPTWKNPKTGKWNACRPALLIKAEDIWGEFVGIQRIFLTEDGGKAKMDKPKLTLGRIRSAGGSVCLRGAIKPEAIITGGPEDGLSLFQKHAELTTVFITCGESNMPGVRLPRWVTRPIVARQNDVPGKAAGAKTMDALRAEGRAPFLDAPKPRFKDWNEEHQAQVESAA